MINQNDPQHDSSNKRLVQDDIEKKNAASLNSAIFSIVFLIVVIAIVAFVYYENNKVVMVPATQIRSNVPPAVVPDTSHTADVVLPPASTPPASINPESADKGTTTTTNTTVQ